MSVQSPLVPAEPGHRELGLAAEGRSVTSPGEARQEELRPPHGDAGDGETADVASSLVPSRGRRHLRLALRIGFLVAVLAFGVFTVRSQYTEVRSSLMELSWPAVVVGLLLAEVSIGLAMLSWRRVLTDLGSPLPLRAASRVYFVGQLGKYLPGSVWPVLAQMELARDHAVPRPRTAAAAIVAIGLGLVGALIVAGALLPFAVQGTGWRLLVLGGLVLGLIVASPPVLNRILGRGLALFRRSPLEKPLSSRGLAVAIGYSASSWLLQGLASYALALPLLEEGSSPARLAALTVGGYAVASAAGIAVLIAPAGLGVREPALLAALTLELSTGGALVVVLAIRLVVTVADLGTGCLLALLPGGRGRRDIPYAADEAG